MTKAKPTDITKFLEAYKRLETAIKDCNHIQDLDIGLSLYSNPSTVLDLENSIENEALKDQIKLCRITRNYIQHHENADSFVCVSQAMTDFVNSLAKDIELLDGCLKDIMTKYPSPVTPQTTVKDCAAVMVKLNESWLPVVDKAGACIGTVEKDNLLKLVSGGVTARTTIKDIVANVDLPAFLQTASIKEIRGLKRVVVVNTKNKVIGF